MHTFVKQAIALTGSIACLVISASAAVIYFPGQDIPIPSTYAGVSINLETGAASNSLDGAVGADMNFFLGGAGISNDADSSAAAPTWQPVRTGTNNDSPVQNLTINTPVDMSLTYATPAGFGGSGGTPSHFPTFTSGTQGYVGFSVVLADTTLAYGWALVTLQNDNVPGVIHSWAYEDTGAPILVGVPEPSHSLLAILGLMTLALRRRR